MKKLNLIALMTAIPLSLVSIPAMSICLTNISAESREERRILNAKSELRTVAVVLEGYYGTPSRGVKIQANDYFRNGDDSRFSAMFEGIRTDPWGNPYQCIIVSQKPRKTSWAVYSTGPDGIRSPQGIGDDICHGCVASGYGAN